MPIAYWIVAGLLAFVYVYSGGMKLVRTQTQLKSVMRWVDQAPMAAVRAIGTLEILGAIGLILPPLTGIHPWLAIAAAAGLAVLQIGAVGLHLFRCEGRQIGLNIVLFILAAAAVWLAVPRD